MIIADLRETVEQRMSLTNISSVYFILAKTFYTLRHCGNCDLQLGDH